MELLRSAVSLFTVTMLIAHLAYIPTSGVTHSNALCTRLVAMCVLPKNTISTLSPHIVMLCAILV